MIRLNFDDDPARLDLVFSSEPERISVTIRERAESFALTFGQIDLRLLPSQQLYPTLNLLPIGGMQE